LIDALGLAVLEDDRQYFPPYDAVPVVHAATLLRFPDLREAISRLAGRISATEMRRMNYAVDGEHRDPAAVVTTFLDRLQGDPTPVVPSVAAPAS
jgi:glycine betaine/choline ABC-type transport system substrate-binding protein